jgi:hypothetical protein
MIYWSYSTYTEEKGRHSHLQKWPVTALFFSLGKIVLSLWLTSGIIVLFTLDEMHFWVFNRSIQPRFLRLNVGRLHRTRSYRLIPNIELYPS